MFDHFSEYEILQYMHMDIRPPEHWQHDGEVFSRFARRLRSLPEAGLHRIARSPE